MHFACNAAGGRKTARIYRNTFLKDTSHIIALGHFRLHKSIRRFGRVWTIAQEFQFLITNAFIFNYNTFITLDFLG